MNTLRDEIFLSQQTVARKICRAEDHCVVLDVRPHGDFVKRHIRGAVHLHLNPMQLRRLVKGILDLETIIADRRCKELLRGRQDEVEFIVYDDKSSTSGVASDIKTYLDVLHKKIQGSLAVLNGGFQAFLRDYANLCQENQGTDLPDGVKSIHCPMVKPPTLSLTGTPKSNCESQELLSTPQIPNLPPTEILPYLYLGTARDSGDIDELRKLGITAILNVSNHCPIHFEGRFRYERIAVEDAYHEDLLSKFRTAAEFIDDVKKNGGRVLVHCFAGISRSATICISYLMLTQGMSMHQAFEFTKTRRPCVSPNFNFMGQLLSFQEELTHIRKAEMADQCAVRRDPLAADTCIWVPTEYEEMDTSSFHSEPKLFQTKKRPGSLKISFNNKPKSADSSPRALINVITDKSSGGRATGLSSSETSLHCSSPLELSHMQHTVTNRA